jgi:hypothetical protein
MPTPSTFYYDSAVFADATNIWDDAALTIPSANGWYQVGGVYRQKVAGLLGPVQACPDCGPGILPCDTPLFGAGGQGVYRVNFDAGGTVGAVVVRWNPFNVPDMLTLTYDGVASSEFSSLVHGYREGYMGRASSGALYTPPLVNGSPGGPYPSGDSYVYNVSAGAFIISGPEAIPVVPATDVSLTTTGYDPALGCSYAVIPKTNPSVTIVECLVYAPSSSTSWEMTVFCPKSLNAFDCSTPGGACSATTKVLYTCSVASGCGDGTNTMLGLNDWVFNDSSGVTSYATNIVAPATTIDVAVLDGDGVTKCVTIDANGVITNIAACAGTC